MSHDVIERLVDTWMIDEDFRRRVRRRPPQMGFSSTRLGSLDIGPT